MDHTEYKGFGTYYNSRNSGNELVDGIMNTSVDVAYLFGYSIINGVSGAVLAVAPPAILPLYI